MKIVNENSLSITLDSINEAFFFDKKISAKGAKEVAKFIASRQGLAGSYACMPAPTKADYANPVALFTGEKVTSHAGTGHILGEEACRALNLLNVSDKKIKDALSRASQGIFDRIQDSEETGGTFGMY